MGVASTWVLAVRVLSVWSVGVLVVVLRCGVEVCWQLCMHVPPLVH